MRITAKHIVRVLILLVFYTIHIKAQQYRYLSLPNIEMLSSDKISCVIQDNEGFLWYGTEGGGICRDDGRQIDIFRSDAAHPNLLGSNNIVCLINVKHNVFIGTFHGAYILDKDNYCIKQLKDVDEKRVDDMIESTNMHIWLTANKKIYEYSAEGKLLNSFITGDKYISRLHQDQHGRLWASQWNGGLLVLNDGHFMNAPWPLDVAPISMADDIMTEGMWIGTAGKGVIHYNPNDGTAYTLDSTSNSICTDLQLCRNRLWVGSLDGLDLFTVDKHPKHIQIQLPKCSCNRITLDIHGNLLVADRKGKPFALSDSIRQWRSHNKGLTTPAADSLQTAWNLSIRPSAIAFNRTDPSTQISETRRKAETALWFSTGKDIRCMSQGKETIVLKQVKDVSAMTFTPDGTMWLATIFGQLYRYKDGKIETDEYGSNEYSDGVISMSTDSLGRLVIESDHYVRIYDTNRHTIRQQSKEEKGVYCIELQETAPYSKWSQPHREKIVERLPQWLTSWWMYCVYILSCICIVSLAIHNYILMRQRKRFLKQMKNIVVPITQKDKDNNEIQVQTDNDSDPPHSSNDVANSSPTDKTTVQDPLLQQAIANIELHLSDDSYSVEQLSSDMCMSRMTFYRKIQSLTGQKPTEFIRTIRLHHAAELLYEGHLSITEISYETGFSSVSYFSRCFRTMFGVPPTQFGKTTTAESLPPKDKPN